MHDISSILLIASASLLWLPARSQAFGSYRPGAIRDDLMCLTCATETMHRFVPPACLPPPVSLIPPSLVAHISCPSNMAGLAFSAAGGCIWHANKLVPTSEAENTARQRALIACASSQWNSFIHLYVHAHTNSILITRFCGSWGFF